MKPLTPAQVKLAAENHQLVYAFLNEKALPEDDYYDVVIFGYLQAVQDYCEMNSLKGYRLSTVVWRRMNRALHDHYRKEDAQKRCHDSISLQAPVGDADGKCWQDVLPDHSNALSHLQAELILHSLPLTPRARRIVRRRMKGYSMHEIARSEKMTFQAIKRLLDTLQPKIADVLKD